MRGIPLHLLMKMPFSCLKHSLLNGFTLLNDVHSGSKSLLTGFTMCYLAGCRRISMASVMAHTIDHWFVLSILNHFKTAEIQRTETNYTSH